MGEPEATPPCLWPIDYECCSEWDNYSTTVQDRAHLLASATLTRLCGYRVTNCPITVRPCKPACVGSYPIPLFTGWFGYPQVGVDSWWWLPSCGCQGECSCTTTCSVALPLPIGRVDEVLVDGAAMPAADYEIADDRLHYIGGGDCPWPACQDLDLPTTEVGTFSVTYVNGHVPDSLAAYAVGVLACEFAKACSGGKCRLPSGVTSVVRQGVSFEIVNGLFSSGFTGIREVDAFIALWNPKGRQQAASVWSPDVPVPRVYR